MYAVGASRLIDKISEIALDVSTSALRFRGCGFRPCDTQVYWKSLRQETQMRIDPSPLFGNRVRDAVS